MLKGFRNNQLLARIVVSFLLTGAVLTGLLLFLVSSFVSDQLTEQRRENARQMLDQAYNTSYGALTDVYGDFYYLWSKDPAILAALSATSLTAAEEKSIARLLEATAFRDPIVYSVCLINLPAGRVISNLSDPTALADYDDPGALALFADFDTNYQAYKNEVFFPRQAEVVRDGSTAEHNFISIVLAVQSPDGSLSAGLIVNIDQDRLSALVNIDQRSRMMVVSRSGKIVSDLDSSLLGHDFPEAKIYEEILARDTTSGSLTADYLGAQSLITYKKADTLGFVFVNIIALDQLLQPVRRTNSIIALLFVGTILLSLLISIFSTRSIYRPLGKLIRAMRENPAVQAEAGQGEYAYLGEAFGGLVAENQQSHLLRLLQGGHNDQSQRVLSFFHTSFLVVVILPDQHPDRAALDEIVRLTRQIIRLPAAPVASGSVAVVFNAAVFDETEMDWILNHLAELQKMVAATMRITVSIGIGSVVTSPDAVKASYRNALAAAQQAGSLGAGQLVPYSEIEHGLLGANQNRVAVAETIDQMIQANYGRTDFAIDEVAEKIGLSVGYLRQIYKLERGLPINEQLIAFRLERACELLTATELTAREISEQVGYLDSRYFYTLFKKRIGMTTDEYRRAKRRGDLP